MKTPNILLITADDMNWDAVGAYGGPTAGVTPNIDHLANNGIRFEKAHVTIAVCQPSRSAMHTGRYPHRSGGEGFFHLRHPGIPILPDLLRKAGYQVGILGKYEHSTPYASFTWDTESDIEDLGMGRNPQEYHRQSRTFFEQCNETSKPFFLMANIHDPHRPFYGNDPAQWYNPKKTVPPAVAPSHIFSSEEVSVPGFLPDLPEVRREIAEYYSSCRRCDDSVGRILTALNETGFAENTMVLFLSDNGMAFPFSKTNCYLHSTKTPWIIAWPNHIQAGQIDREHFISGIDLLPTLLDATGVDLPDGIDGKSFLPLLSKHKQPERNKVFTQFHQTAGGRHYPMRCMQNEQFGYIFNPWSDGERVFKNESQAGRTMAAMEKAAGDDPEIEKRVKLFLYRVPEEFYDFAKDPDAKINLIDDPAYQSEIQAFREQLEQWMVETEDPALIAFRHRNSHEAKDHFMAEIQKQY